MKFKKYEAKLGDTVKINEYMSLKFEKIADDLSPVWHEIPSNGHAGKFEEGTFLSVTPDVWFVFENGNWRVMTPSEHVEATRHVQQSY